MRVMSTTQAVGLEYSRDKRKRRRAHRYMAKYLAQFGGGTIAAVRQWHLWQARNL